MFWNPRVPDSSQSPLLLLLESDELSVLASLIQTLLVDDQWKSSWCSLQRWKHHLHPVWWNRYTVENCDWFPMWCTSPGLRGFSALFFFFFFYSSPRLHSQRWRRSPHPRQPLHLKPLIVCSLSVPPLGKSVSDTGCDHRRHLYIGGGSWLDVACPQCYYRFTGIAVCFWYQKKKSLSIL